MGRSRPHGHARLRFSFRAEEHALPRSRARAPACVPVQACRLVRILRGVGVVLGTRANWRVDFTRQNEARRLKELAAGASTFSWQPTSEQ